MVALAIILIWVLLGIHSVWFFIKRYTLYFDLTTKEIPELVTCFLLPIVTHISTAIVYPVVPYEDREWQILKKKV